MKTASELRTIFLDTCEEFEIDASEISIKFIDKIYSDYKQSIIELIDKMIKEYEPDNLEDYSEGQEALTELKHKIEEPNGN